MRVPAAAARGAGRAGCGVRGERSRPQPAAAGPRNNSGSRSSWGARGAHLRGPGLRGSELVGPRLGLHSAGALPPLPPFPPCRVTATPTPLPDLGLQSRPWRTVPRPPRWADGAGATVPMGHRSSPTRGESFPVGDKEEHTLLS